MLKTKPDTRTKEKFKPVEKLHDDAVFILVLTSRDSLSSFGLLSPSQILQLLLRLYEAMRCFCQYLIQCIDINLQAALPYHLLASSKSALHPMPTSE
jgi:hypothetical protein